FGIPILESMVSGCPVITSSVSSLPEVGGDAALYFNPENPEDIAAQIQRVVGDEQLRQNMINKGKLHAQQFEKSKVTRQLMSIYKQ
ncbi:MAG TPA: glycosyltransferase, partial [Chitinophagales bacterium]|nr:glycosyltransferase [Chitinophagales bacterium]